MSVSKKNQTVLITGTTSGLGKALSEYYASEGWRVVAVNRRDLKIQDVPGRILHRICQISSEKEVDELIADLMENDWIPDIWILNAGINEVDNEERLNLETFRRVLDTNLFGALSFVQALQSKQFTGKTVVGISSTSTVVPNPNSLGYCVGKDALNLSFKLFELRDSHNRYQVVMLGPTNTQLNRSLPPMDGVQAKIFQALALTPEKAARKIVRFIGRRQRVLHPSWRTAVLYRLLSFVLFLWPGLYYRPYRKGDWL